MLLGYITKQVASHPVGAVIIGLGVTTGTAEGAIEAAQGNMSTETIISLIAACGGAFAAVCGGAAAAFKGIASIIRAWAYYKHGGKN